MTPIKLSALVPALLSVAAAVPVTQFPPSNMSQGIVITYPAAVYPLNTTAIPENVGYPLVKHPLQPNETTLQVTYQNETGVCNYANAVVRKEYSSLSKNQRLQYINAVKCLMDKPSVVPGVPATQSYYSDFAFLHINYARYTHFNGNFFGWHRHHVWLFEQALHGCGFPKELGVPYMYWPMYGEHGFENSTIFDESETSLGGNGWPTPLRDGNDRRVPHGTGGGCVMRGPFHDMVLNFQSFYDRYALPGLPDDWAVPVKRCLDRDLNQWLLQNNLNQTIYDNTLRQPTLALFQNSADDPFSSFAMHVAGHGAVGMTMNDLFGGTIDPSFWLHHASVDHLWNQWQEQDPARRHEYYGTDVVYNAGGNPVGPDTVLEFSTVGPRIKLGEVQDPMSGPYCYRFEEPICLDGRGCPWMDGH
jgi:tyrosinase